MKWEFQSIQELMEYVEKEAWRRAKVILEGNGLEVHDLKSNLGAGGGI